MTESTALFTQTPISHRRWMDALLLLIVLAVAVALRVTHQDADPSFDELWHLGTTKGLGPPLGFSRDVVIDERTSRTSLDGAGSLLGVWTGMDDVLHPPLYCVTLRIWREVFGESDRIAQAYSLLWSLVSIGFVFATARLSMNRAMAVLCGLTLACAQTQIYFAQEIRSYAMLIGIGSIALWAMTRIELRGSTRGRAITLAVCLLALQMTHYFAFGANVAIVLYGLMKLKGCRKVFVASCAAAVLVFAITWLPFSLRQIAMIGTGDALVSGEMGSLRYVLLNSIGAPFRVLAERNFELDLLPVACGVLFFLPWLLMRRFPAMLPWSLWLCCSIGGVVLLDLARGTGSVALVRYLAICSPAVPLLFAGVVWPVNRVAAYLSIGSAWFAGFIYLLSGNIVWVDSQDYSGIARAISTRIQPGDAILTYEVPGATWNSDTWMLTVNHVPGLFPRKIAVLTKPMTSEMIDALETRKAWLITSGGEPVEKIIPGARVVGIYGATPGVSVLHLELEPASTTQASPREVE